MSVFFAEFARQGAWDQSIDKNMLLKAIKKAGDFAGCPIPDKIAESLGELKALVYLTDLSTIFLKLQSLFNETNSVLAQEWGKSERREILAEPWGEDCSRVPEEIRSKNLLRGPGKYQEFSITRLLWIDQQEVFIKKKLGFYNFIELVKSVSSLDELQVDLIAAIAEVRIKSEPKDNLSDILSKGISHEGFFKQNNPYEQVKRVYNLLKIKYADKKWFPTLENQIIRVMNSPISQYC